MQRTIRTSHSFTRLSERAVVVKDSMHTPSLTGNQLPARNKADDYIAKINAAFRTRAVVGILREV